MVDDDVEQLVTSTRFDRVVKSFVSLHEFNERTVHAFDVVLSNDALHGSHTALQISGHRKLKLLIALLRVFFHGS